MGDKRGPITLFGSLTSSFLTLESRIYTHKQEEEDAERTDKMDDCLIRTSVYLTWTGSNKSHLLVMEILSVRDVRILTTAHIGDAPARNALRVVGLLSLRQSFDSISFFSIIILLGIQGYCAHSVQHHQKTRSKNYL